MGKESAQQQSQDDIPQLRVFLSHASDDRKYVRSLARWLREMNVVPWIDEAELIGGQDWKFEIDNAIGSCDVVVICLSHRAVSKTGYIQKEIRRALEFSDLRPEGGIHIIPVKLEECNVPKHLQRWQWVNLFESNGYDRLLLSLQRSAEQLGRRSVGAATLTLPDQYLAQLGNDYAEIQSGPYKSFFGQLATLKIAKLSRDLRSMTGNHPFSDLRAYDPAKQYAEIFIHMIGKRVLEGSEFCAVAHLVVTLDFGAIDRRYLIANVVAVKKRNIKIRRVFVVEPLEELIEDKSRAKSVLSVFREYESFFEGSNVEISVYCCADREEYLAGFARGSHSGSFAFWKLNSGQEVCVLVEYKLSEDEKYKIDRILFDSAPELIADKRDIFNWLQNRSVKLRQFVVMLESLLATPQ